MNSVGRADQSLEAAREAVGLYEELAATAAAEHAKHLGDALGFMAALLGDAGCRDEAEALFAEVLTRFAETPDGFGPIFVVRGDWHISHGDMRAAIDDLDAAMRAAENAGDRSTRGRVRGYLRYFREQDSSSFDRAWEDRQQVPLPVWLRYLTDDDRLISNVGSWATIEVLPEAREYLEGHADVLLTDEAEAALEHFIDIKPPGTDSRNSSSLCGGGTRGRDRQRVRRSHATGPGGEKGKLLYDWLRNGGRWQVIRDFAVAHASDLVDPVTVTPFDRICGSHPEWARSGCIGGSCIWRQRRKTGRPCFARLTNWRLTQAACGPRSTRPTRRFLGVLALRSPGYKAASTTTSRGALPTRHRLAQRGGSGRGGVRPAWKAWAGTLPGHAISLEHLAEARAVLADCADNAAPYERRDFARRLAEFLAQRALTSSRTQPSFSAFLLSSRPRTASVL
jgi:hypothetical protein